MRVPLEINKSPTALARGRAAHLKEVRTNQNSKATKKLQAWTDDLEAMAIWREDLQSRIWRAQLIFELVACSQRDEDLAVEVELFTQVCAELAAAREEPLSEGKAA